MIGVLRGRGQLSDAERGRLVHLSHTGGGRYTRHRFNRGWRTKCSGGRTVSGHGGLGDPCDLRNDHWSWFWGGGDIGDGGYLTGDGGSRKSVRLGHERVADNSSVAVNTRQSRGGVKERIGRGFGRNGSKRGLLSDSVRVTTQEGVLGVIGNNRVGGGNRRGLISLGIIIASKERGGQGQTGKVRGRGGGRGGSGGGGQG